MMEGLFSQKNCAMESNMTTCQTCVVEYIGNVYSEGSFFLVMYYEFTAVFLTSLYLAVRWFRDSTLTPNKGRLRTVPFLTKKQLKSSINVLINPQLSPDGGKVNTVLSPTKEQ